MSKKIYQSNEVSIYFDAEPQKNKLKIIVKKKDYSLAVHRNKIKRWVREIFKKYSLNNGFVVVVRVGLLEKGFKELSLELGGPLESFAKDI